MYIRRQRRTPLRGAWIEIEDIADVLDAIAVSHPAQGCVD